MEMGKGIKRIVRETIIKRIVIINELKYNVFSYYNSGRKKNKGN